MTGDTRVGTGPGEPASSLDQRLRSGDTQALAELFTQERERLWRGIHFRAWPRRCGDGWSRTTCCRKRSWPRTSGWAITRRDYSIGSDFGGRGVKQWHEMPTLRERSASEEGLKPPRTATLAVPETPQNLWRARSEPFEACPPAHEDCCIRAARP